MTYGEKILAKEEVPSYHIGTGFDDDVKLLNFLNFNNSYGIKIRKKILRHASANNVSVQYVLSLGLFVDPNVIMPEVAAYYGLEYINIRTDRGDPRVYKQEHTDIYIEKEFVPWQIVSGRMVVAICEYSEENMQYIEQLYEQKISFIYTDRQSLINVINDSAADYITSRTLNYLFENHPKYSAKYVYKSKSFKLCIYSILTVFFVSLFFQSANTLLSILLFSNMIYFANILVKTIIFILGLKKKVNNITIKRQDLPVYSIIVPLYKEDKIIKQLIKSLIDLDYPKSKLDIKLVIEKYDDETYEIIKKLNLPKYFEIIKVPKSYPKTKPKACSYALNFIKGEFVTIYDAEDIPCPVQLIKVVDKFHKSEDRLVCVQAYLNYYNKNTNWLSNMFAIEYKILFEYFLPGLSKLNSPLPLGGTSNHFKTKIFKQIGGWDPYNVTEDADLGFRLELFGYKSETIDSYTMEESPSKMTSWIKQRTRWIKGHLQTIGVHLRQPKKALDQLGFLGFASFIMLFACSLFVFIFSPFIWLTLIIGLAYIELPPGYYNISLLVLALATIMQMLAALIVSEKKSWQDYLYCFSFPCYFLLHSIAAIRAVHQLIKSPHKWEKTTHGLHLKGR